MNLNIEFVKELKSTMDEYDNTPICNRGEIGKKLDNLAFQLSENQIKQAFKMLARM